jgi:DNA polymerase III alpha subunit
MNPSFAHLHTHSRYSFLEGTASIEELVDQAIACGMKALALTDCDFLCGAIPFARAARTRGLLPIAGLCLTLEGRCLTLLARDRQGFVNLCRLSTLKQALPANGSIELPLEGLAPYTDGLIVLTGGRNGFLWSAAVQGRVDELHQIVGKLTQVTERGSLYIEAQWLDHRDERALTVLRQVAQDFDLPMAATHEVRSLRPEEVDVRRLLTAIRTDRQMDDPTLIREAPSGLYFLSADEMVRRFQDLPEALSGTIEIVSCCQDAFPRQGSFLSHSAETPWLDLATALLRSRTEEGALQTYGEPLPETVAARLVQEISEVEEMRASPLFLMLGEGLRAAYEKGLWPLLKGEALGSLLLYLLGASHLDPLEHELVWEFFFAPGEVGFPEVHLWLDSGQRDQFSSLLRELWSADRCVGAAELLCFSARAAWRAAAQAYGLDRKRIEQVGRNLPWREEPGDVAKWTVWDDLFREAEGQAEKLALQAARVLVGWPQGVADEPQGWALLPRLPDGIIPTMHSSSGVSLAQYSPKDLRFLGSVVLEIEEERSLSLLVESGRWAEEPLGHPREVPFRDEQTAKMLKAAHTLGCHRLERPSTRRLLRELAPASVVELTTVLALQQPVVLRAGLPQAFIRHLRERAKFLPVPCFSEVVQDTGGLLLYREQIWVLIHERLGWPVEEAQSFLDSLFSSPSSRERGQWWNPFMRRALQVDQIEREQADTIWNAINAAANWVVSRADLVMEAFLAWWMIFLKGRDPMAFLAALLMKGAGGYAQSTYLAEARRLGLVVQPPHVHHSGREFTVERGGEDGSAVLWMGLEAVRGLSSESIERILKARQQRPFSSVEGFLARVRPESGEAERLARIGALDGLEPNRSAAIREVRWRTRGPSSQMLLPFEFSEEAEDLSQEEILSAEQEILGVAVSVHPLDLVEGKLRALQVVSSAELAGREGEMVAIAGVVASVRTVQGEAPGESALLTLEDRYGRVEVLLPVEVYEDIQEDLRPSRVLLVRGRVRPDAVLSGQVLVIAGDVELWR